MTTLTLPAGTYVLGDPCYAIRDEHWMPWLGEQISEPVVDNEIWGHRAIAFGTAHGDGAFTGSDGFEYGVDAGMIGLVPVAAADLSPNATWKRACTLLTMGEPFTCTRDEDGTLTFGHVEIRTDWDQYDLDEEENNCEKCGTEIDEWLSFCTDCEDEDEPNEEDES